MILTYPLNSHLNTTPLVIGCTTAIILPGHHVYSAKLIAGDFHAS